VGTAAVVSRWKKKSEHEQTFIDSQVCVYVCGLCDYTFTGTLADWLADREAHRFAVHPDWRPRKRKMVGMGRRAKVAA
jgi:hypothetical protein